MADKTGISWTDATANLWWGCVEVGPGCDHCYAKALAKRWGFGVWGVHSPRRMMPNVWALFARLQRRAVTEGRRLRVFVQSMSDICEVLPFDHPQRREMDEARSRFFCEVIPACPDLDFLLLTKRVGNFPMVVPASWLGEHGKWPANAWPMVTVVNQIEADRDISKLLALPASVRGLSIEPLVAPVDLSKWMPAGRCRWQCSGCRGFHAASEDRFGHITCLHCEKVDYACGSHVGNGKPNSQPISWVIVGGESGPNARPMHSAWARSLRDQCTAAGVAFHFKQWGEHLGLAGFDPSQTYSADCPRSSEDSIKVGVKKAGRLLDGVTHDGFPEVRS